MQISLQFDEFLDIIFQSFHPNLSCWDTQYFHMILSICKNVARFARTLSKCGIFKGRYRNWKSGMRLTSYYLAIFCKVVTMSLKMDQRNATKTEESFRQRWSCISTDCWVWTRAKIQQKFKKFWPMDSQPIDLCQDIDTVWY